MMQRRCACGGSKDERHPSAIPNHAPPTTTPPPKRSALPSQDDREFAAALIDRILRAASGREAGEYLLEGE